MGAKLGGGGDDLEINHEINVTPFIDVILVLLIIFMVAAPLATVDVPVDLPGSAAPPQARPDKPLYVSLKSDLTLAIGETTMSRDAVGPALDAVTAGDRGQRVFLRADKAVSYGDLMAVMNAFRRAGYLKVALVGLEETGTPASPAATGAVPAAAPAAPRP